MTEPGDPVVLVVEDDPETVEQYRDWLSEYNVRHAPNGERALASIDDSVDVVVLDRALPDMTGAEVLREIREGDIDVRVVIATTMEADFDVIHMGFDAYVRTPVEREAFLDTVEEVLERAALRHQLREYYSLMSRKGALEADKPVEELQEREEYVELLDRIEAAEAAVDETTGDMASESEFVGAVREVADEHDEEKLDEWEERIAETERPDGGDE